MVQGGITVPGFIKMAKKSQMKMMESIFVLFLFFFLLAFGVVFYVNYSRSEAEDTLRERMISEGLDSTERFQYSPEVVCTEGITEDSDCFDLLKLEAFKDLSSKRTEQYRTYYPNNIIRLNIIFPESKERSWVIYNYTIPYENATRSVTSYIPAVFFNSSSEERYFGYLEFEARS